MNRARALLIIGAFSDMGVNLILFTYGKFNFIIAHYRNMNERLDAVRQKLTESERVSHDVG